MIMSKILQKIAQLTKALKEAGLKEDAGSISLGDEANKLKIKDEIGEGFAFTPMDMALALPDSAGMNPMVMLEDDPDKMSIDDIMKIVRAANLDSNYSNSLAAAMAISETMFYGEKPVVCFVNKFLFKKGKAAGYAAVLLSNEKEKEKLYLDCRGIIVSEEQMISRAEATEEEIKTFGGKPADAYDVAKLTDTEASHIFSTDKVSQFGRALELAERKILDNKQ